MKSLKLRIDENKVFKYGITSPWKPHVINLLIQIMTDSLQLVQLTCSFLFFHTLDLDLSVNSSSPNFCYGLVRSLDFLVSLVLDPSVKLALRFTEVCVCLTLKNSKLKFSKIA